MPIFCPFFVPLAKRQKARGIEGSSRRRFAQGTVSVKRGNGLLTHGGGKK